MASPSYGLPSGYKMKGVPQFTPEQMRLFQSLLQSSQGGVEGGMDFLTRLASGDESMFQELEAPAYASFQKNIGSIANRFSQLGAQDSSAFQNMLAGAGSELAQNLQAQRLGLRERATKDLLNQSQLLLQQKPYETMLQQKKQGTDWGGMVSSGLGILAKLLPLFL